jgi:hypothetical protein
MNKTNLLVVIIIVLLAIVVGIIVYNSQNTTKTVDDFYNIDISTIDKIDIMNGSNGNITTVNNKKVINDICSYLSALTFKKAHSEPSTGWDYRFFIYENGQKEFEVTFISNKLCIFNNNGIKYSMANSTDVTYESLYNEAVKSAK